MKCYCLICFPSTEAQQEDANSAFNQRAARMDVFRPSKQVAEQESTQLNTTSLPNDVAATVAGITRIIFEREQLPQILESFCEEACHLLGADNSLFARVEADEREPVWKILHAHNLSGDFLKKSRPPTASYLRR